MQWSLVYIFIHIYGVKTTHCTTSIDSKVIHSRLSFNVNCNLDIRSCHVGYFQLNVRAAKGCRLCSQSSTLQCCALCCPIMNDNFHLTCTNLQKGAPGNLQALCETFTVSYVLSPHTDTALWNICPIQPMYCNIVIYSKFSMFIIHCWLLSIEYWSAK